MKTKFLSFLALSCLLATNSFAHDLIITKSGENKFEAKFGHLPDKFNEYNPKQLLNATAFDETGEMIKTGINYKFDNNISQEIVTEKSPAVLIGVYSSGGTIFSDDKKRHKNADKSEVKGTIFAATKSVSINKNYFVWSENLIKPLGLKLELVALANPFKLSVGDTLPVLVLKDGKAAKNIRFYTAKDEPKIFSDEFGIALLPIKKAGIQNFSAYTQEQIFEENANSLNINTSISFEIK